MRTRPRRIVLLVSGLVGAVSLARSAPAGEQFQLAPAGAGKPAQALAAFGGKLDIRVENDRWLLTVPKLGYGEIVRIDVR